MPLTKEEVFETADRLAEQGQRPTLTAVRNDIISRGGKGSFSTISDAMKAWWAQKEEDRELSNMQIPDAVADRGQQFVAALWQAATEESERRLTAEREALSTAQKESEEAIKEANEAVETLEAEAAERDAEIDQLRAKLRDAEQRALYAEDQMKNIGQELTTAKATADAQIQGLNARLDDMRKNDEDRKSEIERLRLDRDTAKNQINNIQKNLTMLEIRLSESNDRLTSSKQRENNLNKQISEIKNDNKKQIDNLKNQIKEMQQREKLFDDQIREARKDYRGHLTELKEELKLALKAKHDAEKEITELRKKAIEKTKSRS